MKYKYITLLNFGGIDQRVGLEQSNYELVENKIIGDYRIHIRINDEQFSEIHKLLYEKVGKKDD